MAPLSEAQEKISARLQQDVEMLAGRIGERNLWNYQHLAAAADYIEAELRAAGWPVQRQVYQAEQRQVANLVAEIPGRQHPEQILLIGAHYDSVLGSPGANDNGSGVAALLEMARRLAGRPAARTIRLVAFVNEEPPFFQTVQMGSRVYVEQVKQRGEKIVAMLCLETIGYYSQQPSSQKFPFLPLQMFYPEQGNFIAFVANLKSGPLLHRSLRLFRKHSDFPAEGLVAPSLLPGVDWSDQWSFWRAGYPAIMLTDTAPFRYPYYHSRQDTPDKLSYPEFARVVDGLLAVVRELAR